MTNPDYLASSVFDSFIENMFLQNTEDKAVRDQAIAFIHLVRKSRHHRQIISDVLHATQASGRNSTEQIAEIGFVMGLQFGFELGITYPPK